MKFLPKNISAHPDGYLVRIKRGDLAFKAFVPYGRADALEEALRRRDRFYKICPKPQPYRSKGRSNTDVVGITETESWRRGLPYRNFIVRAGGQNKRFYFGRSGATRGQAFKLAVAHRARSIGKKPKEILPNPTFF